MAIIELYSKESSFQRAMRIAEDRKRKAWAEYYPLPRECFEDDWSNPGKVTIVVIGETGTRSTFGRPQKRSTSTLVMRPTEMTATALAYSRSDESTENLVVIRLDPYEGLPMRKCGKCHKTLAIGRFDRAKRNVSGVGYLNGISFYCSDCRKKLGRQKAA